MITVQKEFKVFTKPQEVLVQMLQERNRAIYTALNNLNYRPQHGA
ncbi:MAG: hypothetical protein NTW78_05300 [Campylobacterales bacterium]|nr:hypothetical protein [Campylobacterales bacterium]